MSPTNATSNYERTHHLVLHHAILSEPNFYQSATLIGLESPKETHSMPGRWFIHFSDFTMHTVDSQPNNYYRWPPSFLAMNTALQKHIPRVTCQPWYDLERFDA
jgi:hypothetical protein